MLSRSPVGTATGLAILPAVRFCAEYLSNMPATFLRYRMR
jgi:hypothetical protein